MRLCASRMAPCNFLLDPSTSRRFYTTTRDGLVTAFTLKHRYLKLTLVRSLSTPFHISRYAGRGELISEASMELCQLLVTGGLELGVVHQNITVGCAHARIRLMKCLITPLENIDFRIGDMFHWVSRTYQSCSAAISFLHRTG